MTGGGGSSKQLDTVAQCVAGVLEEENFQINSAAYQNLLVHLAIAVERIRANQYVPMPSEHVDSLQREPEYAVAEKLATAVSQAFQIELPQEEIAYISIHLAAKQTLGMPGDDDGIVISDDVWRVVARMLELVWDAYHFDFRHDLELRMNLARHIVPLSIRLRYRMRMDNPLLTDIKQRFPVAYSMALDASCVLAEEYGATLSEDEVGYIALAFALAIERQKSELPRKNILVVCASGQGSARLLEWRYRQEFGAWIDRIEVCDASHVSQCDLTDIDYVFTTVPLSCSLPVPVCEVQYFLDDEDAGKVRRALQGAAESALPLVSYFDRRLFMGDLAAETKDEVLDKLCACVAACRDVPENFRELVGRRERLAQTSFGNLVAMPHPVMPVSDETFVAVAVLKEPIAWDGQAVQVVFLVSVSTARTKKLDGFYRAMARLMGSGEAMQTLARGATWPCLLDVLKTYESDS